MAIGYVLKTGNESLSHAINNSCVFDFTWVEIKIIPEGDYEFYAFQDVGVRKM